MFRICDFINSNSMKNIKNYKKCTLKLEEIKKDTIFK